MPRGPDRHASGLREVNNTQHQHITATTVHLKQSQGPVVAAPGFGVVHVSGKVQVSQPHSSGAWCSFDDIFDHKQLWKAAGLRGPLKVNAKPELGFDLIPAFQPRLGWFPGEPIALLPPPPALTSTPVVQSTAAPSPQPNVVLHPPATVAPADGPAGRNRDDRQKADRAHAHVHQPPQQHQQQHPQHRDDVLNQAAQPPIEAPAPPPPVVHTSRHSSQQRHRHPQRIDDSEPPQPLSQPFQPPQSLPVQPDLPSTTSKPDAGQGQGDATSTHSHELPGDRSSYLSVESLLPMVKRRARPRRRNRAMSPGKVRERAGWLSAVMQFRLSKQQQQHDDAIPEHVVSGVVAPSTTVTPVPGLPIAPPPPSIGKPSTHSPHSVLTCYKRVSNSGLEDANIALAPPAAAQNHQRTIGHKRCHAIVEDSAGASCSASLALQPSRSRIVGQRHPHGRGSDDVHALHSKPSVAVYTHTSNCVALPPCPPLLCTTLPESGGGSVDDPQCPPTSSDTSSQHGFLAYGLTASHSVDSAGPMEATLTALHNKRFSDPGRNKSGSAQQLVQASSQQQQNGLVGSAKRKAGRKFGVRPDAVHTRSPNSPVSVSENVNLVAMA